jgi:tRNA threonylcarbamoyladenosine biosynthesis protein TsaE
LNEYQINQTKINHYDLFRIKSAEEIKNLDLFEDNAKSITLVEWPQMIIETPKNLIKLNFEYEKDYQTRSVQIEGLNL